MIQGLATILVMGCTGFIGSHLVKRLIDDGHTVFGVIRYISRQVLKNLDETAERIRLIEADLREFHSIHAALQFASPQIVVHLGALTPVRLSYDDPFPYLRTNFEGTCNVVHAMIDCTPKARLIYASTAEIYGWQEKTPTNEDAPLRPASPYAVSKAAADQYVQMAAKVYGLNSTILRPNNSYGRTSETQYFVEYVVTAMLSGKPVYVGAPDHKRDYMHVEDHVAAYAQVINHIGKPGDIFNISPGHPVTNLHVAQLVKNITQSKSAIVEGSYPPLYPHRLAKWDTREIILDSSKIRSEYGWEPRIDLESGLHKLVEYWTTKVARSMR